MSMPPRNELQEKDFIQESYSSDPYPFWFWLGLLAMAFIILWGGYAWVNRVVTEEYASKPFLQVTNRAFSLFLWQNPEFMRVNAKSKAGYLPGFQYMDKVTLELDLADEYVVAPPEVLFRYHTWDRLLRDWFPQRPISIDEFRQFLSYVEEWQPQYWPGAPDTYINLVSHLNDLKMADLSTLPDATLPREVRLAFQGWKNYYKEGEKINTMQVQYGEMEEFLSKFPHYARNYWRNIVKGDEKSSKNDNQISGYLYTLTFGTYKPEDQIPSKEMAPFLKVAFFNYKMSKEHQ